jgi:cell division protein FtsB
MKTVLVFISVILVLLVVCAILFMMYKNQKEKYKKLKYDYKLLEQQFKQANEIAKIKEQNNAEAIQKINDLFNGDIVDNAISGLSKPKK